MIAKLPSVLRPPWPGGLSSVLSALFAASLLWSCTKGYTDAVTWAAFAYLLYDSIRNRRMFSCGGIGLPLLAFLIICGISAFNSVVPKESPRAFLKLIQLSAGCIALINLLRPGDRATTATRTLAFAMLALIAIDSLVLLHDQWRPGPKSFLTDGRWSGSHFGFPTIAAAVTATAFVLTTALLLHTKSSAVRIACAAGLILGGILFNQYQTRSVFLGLAGGLGLLLLLTIKDRKRALATAALSALVLATALLGSPKFRERVLSGSSSGRDAIWTDARLQISRQIPQYKRWFGYGYGHGVFKETYKMTLKRDIRAKVRLDHTHNMMLEILLQAGWFGLAAWLWLLAATAWQTLRALLVATGPTRWTIGALASALLALLIYGQFSLFFALAPHFLFWNLLGLLLAACSAAHFQRLEKPAP